MYFQGLFTTEAELLRHRPLLPNEAAAQSPFRLALRALLTSNVMLVGAFGVGLFALKQTLGIHTMNDLRETLGIRRHVPGGQLIFIPFFLNCFLLGNEFSLKC